MSLRDGLHKARLLAAGSVLAAGGLASMATPAVASSQGTSVAKDVAPMVIAPPCIRTSHRSDTWHNYIDVRNTCGRTYRIKVVMSFAFDSACVTLDNGRTFTHAYGEWGSLDRVDIC